MIRDSIIMVASHIHSDDIVFKLKEELRKMRKGDLLRMVSNQKERKCLLGGVCPFLLKYQRILFCVSEILEQGCQIERQRLDSVQEAQSESESSQKSVKLPIADSAMLAVKLVKNGALKVYKGGSHGMRTTQKHEVNADLLSKSGFPT